MTEEAFAHTRAGWSKEKEERTAEARYEEYTRTHKSAGLKKPKISKPKRGRGRGGGGGILGMFGFGGMGMGYDRFDRSIDRSINRRHYLTLIYNSNIPNTSISYFLYVFLLYVVPWK